jgi:beta-phosphoglucomutase
MKPKAFLFDLNGTMINDMDYHLRVWYDVLVNELGSTLSLEGVRSNMYGKNDELFVRVFGSDKFTKAQMDEIAHRKEVKYQELYKPHLKLIDGLHNFLNQAHAAGIKMAIGSAAIPFNIDFVLDNLDIRHYFSAIVSADDVVESKPHPEVFLKAAQLLGAAPAECIVFEDAPKGVEAAARAGMKSVALTTLHAEHEFKGLSNILFFAPDYTGSDMTSLVQV